MIRSVSVAEENKVKKETSRHKVREQVDDGPGVKDGRESGVEKRCEGAESVRSNINSRTLKNESRRMKPTAPRHRGYFCRKLTRFFFLFFFYRGIKSNLRSMSALFSSANFHLAFAWIRNHWAALFVFTLLFIWLLIPLNVSPPLSTSLRFAFIYICPSSTNCARGPTDAAADAQWPSERGEGNQSITNSRGAHLLCGFCERH